ncbi:uncharacterized protein LOC122614269 isoform X1 [Drosophila teissieri]|uniref:uncharacterized protein LOC122614269 isoform X1 n=1 Tax=Drosophila teissieri TaxID=7243 RepID=UPI001CBA415B|nr:uncharacterized protein LOC122614269 isoform X1 [Drosophila teissieri]
MVQLTLSQIQETAETCCYLPHHAVIKLDSLTTNCSSMDQARTAVGSRSIGGFMLDHRFSVTFLEFFRLYTVTYSLAPSPFLAVRVLKQRGDDDVPRVSCSSRRAHARCLSRRYPDRISLSRSSTANATMHAYGSVAYGIGAPTSATEQLKY